MNIYDHEDAFRDANLSLCELLKERDRLRSLLEFTLEAIENFAKLRGVNASLAVAGMRIKEELGKK